MHQINIDVGASKGRSLREPLLQATFLKPLTSDHRSFERIGPVAQRSLIDLCGILNLWEHPACSQRFPRRQVAVDEFDGHLTEVARAVLD
jgi:hypothetical protein